MNETAAAAVAIFEVKRGNGEKKKSKGEAIKIHVYEQDRRNFESSRV
jgi:hypothetical protein